MVVCHGVLMPSITTNHCIIWACHLCPALNIMHSHLSAMMSPVISFKFLKRTPLVCHITLDPRIRKKVCCRVGIPSYVTK